MVRRRLAPALLIAALVTALVALGAPRTAAQIPGQYMASESYYRLDVDAGSLEVRVEAEVQSDGGELADVWLWVMPQAQDLKVEQDGLLLQTEVVEAATADLPQLISATLAEPLKGSLRADLIMTYTVPPHVSETSSMEPGAMEVMFVGQGHGSFILLDLLTGADNYVDPGCVMVSDQPGDVRDAGLERYMCGEATMAAISLDDPRVTRQCANLDDRCRQRVIPGPFNGYVQSITDSTKQGHLEAEVTLMEAPVTLRLNYFRKDETWAKEQFEIATAALPALESVFGFPYPFDTITMRQSHHIALAGAAGIAFPTVGEVLLVSGTGFDEEVTIHELAHQWAGFNLDRKWMWEGLAEYATQRVAPGLGVTVIDRGWGDAPYDEHLTSWAYASPVTDPDYWYGRAGAFWHAYEAAVGGPDAVTSILAAGNNPQLLPLTEAWFMDQGERHSGANLDALFLDWVWNAETATPLVETRRAAWDGLKPLRERSTALGLSGLPTDIEDRLNAWQFSGIERYGTRAAAVLDDFEEVQSLAAAAGLPVSNVLAETWGLTSIESSAERVTAQRLAINAITEAAAELDSLGAGPESYAIIEEARVMFAEGDVTAAADHASSAVAMVLNRIAAGEMVEAARREQVDFKPDLFTRVGIMFSNPAGDLAAAEAALADGDFEKALRLSQSAAGAWDGAQARGFQRLAILAGLMAALSTGAWWLLARLNREDEPPPLASGHSLGEKRPSWRDWENS